jgi:hypothetical protein
MSPQILHEEICTSYEQNDAKEVGFWLMNDRLWDHWNRSLFSGFVRCSGKHATQAYFNIGKFDRYTFHLVAREI